jgi:hypothetical protein
MLQAAGLPAIISCRGFGKRKLLLLSQRRKRSPEAAPNAARFSQPHFLTWNSLTASAKVCDCSCNDPAAADACSTNAAFC